MPRKHSDHFNDLTHQIGSEYRLDPVVIEQKLQSGDLDYGTMSDLLRETNDAQFGIVSTLNNDNEWVRDATHTIPLDERMSHDAPVIEANNTLLRCLSRLRPIDYAINRKLGDNSAVIQVAMQQKFVKLSSEILKIAQGSNSDKEKNELIRAKEKEFNTFLVETLHDANLTLGCDNEKDAEKLLFHYRNLSSTLTPARTMVTLTYDSKAKVLQRETQYPVTEKTETQKEALNNLNAITPYPFKDEKNSHTRQEIAFQEADSLFAELLVQDDKALGAQARKTHLVGAKNAFVVKNELITIDDEDVLEVPGQIDDLSADEDNVLWLGRMGSPVFVGKGEKNHVLQTHTRENLEQVRTTAIKKMGKEPATLNLHVTTLNTDSPLENQSTIIDHVYEATRKREDNKDDVSYAPTNPDGTFRVLDIAQGLDFDREPQPWGSAPLQKATRLESVTKVALAASRTDNTFSIVHCASGQDRTGTVIEKCTQEWMKKKYHAMGINDYSNIESMRTMGGNAAEITSHHIHGSPGMKTDSIANNFFGSKTTFSSRVTEELYLSSAKTNKQNKVGHVDFLKQPSPLAVEEYNSNIKAFAESLKKEPNDLLRDKGNEVLKQVQAIAKGEPEKLDPRSLSDLTQVLATSNKSLTEASMPEQTQDNAKRLAALSHHVSGKSSPGWKALGLGLLTFACAALVVVGVLAAIPSGGSSLLLTAVGSAGLSATIGAGAGVAAAGVAGIITTHHGREQGLAKSVHDFKTALTEIKDYAKTQMREEPIDEVHSDQPRYS